MNTYQIDGKPEILGFTNLKRVDEEEFFAGILEKLKENPNISVGEKKTGPSEDTYECSISDIPFILLYDVDYGPSIYAENQEAIRNLKQYFG